MFFTLHATHHHKPLVSPDSRQRDRLCPIFSDSVLIVLS